MSQTPTHLPVPAFTIQALPGAFHIDVDGRRLGRLSFEPNREREAELFTLLGVYAPVVLNLVADMLAGDPAAPPRAEDLIRVTRTALTASHRKAAQVA